MTKFKVSVKNVFTDGEKQKDVSYVADVYALNLKTSPPKFLAYDEKNGFHLVEVTKCKPVSQK